MDLLVLDLREPYRRVDDHRKESDQEGDQHLGQSPKPNQTSSSGAIATFGIACEETSKGKIERANGGHRKSRAPAGLDHDAERESETISSVVIQPWTSSNPALDTSDRTTTLGGGRRYGEYPARGCPPPRDQDRKHDRNRIEAEDTRARDSRRARLR